MSEDWGCGHVLNEDGTPANIKCVECYLDWYLDQKEQADEPSR